MKIALTGAHGTGKSTLAKSLKIKLESQGLTVNITPEVPRLICEKVQNPEFFRREYNSISKQTLILLGQLVIEKSVEKTDVLICDRILFDHWAYTEYLFREEINKDNLTLVYEAFIAEYCKSYDMIFYLPIEFKPIDDGVRESDIEFQSAIDYLITTYLKKYSLQYHVIKGTIDERSQTILKILNI